VRLSVVKISPVVVNVKLLGILTFKLEEEESVAQPLFLSFELAEALKWTSALYCTFLLICDAAAGAVADVDPGAGTTNSTLVTSACSGAMYVSIGVYTEFGATESSFLRAV